MSLEFALSILLLGSIAAAYWVVIRFLRSLRGQ